MAKALWQGQVIAESDEFEVVEGNVYFPPGAIDDQYFKASNHQSVCPWKGTASYYDVVVDGQRNENAAWYYPQPKDAAANIRDHVAFWKGVTVER
ncbi:MAG: DUF427 domain-containing protein [Deltaproteobacteria bacterium]|nr:DUF427 domain-containing protein [Deltaproteobacteria bacterium]NND28380.1 DUF427 domain-containing protein [Myxococcales bacterium]MBT8465966.1 DUF427 domain-containing protein [Deltaproteobacteria bacterium]MBT8482299.1 DUF427 domain-containing protein [Deltaproteobacteria bacterium]NNK05752.1 DUF427 domain-containing protein [Myxococcales bacterium]